jgi:SAM-dependent methyltransferase
MSISTTDHPVESADTAEIDERVAALADRLFQAGLAAIDIFTVYLGLRLGLYRALAEGGPMRNNDLAAAAGIAPRYAQEWLEQQTVTGIVTCLDRSVEAAERRYELPAGHDVVLLDADSPACLAPIALAAAGIAGVLPQLLDAYRAGTGVPYAAYGTDFRDGQAGFNRPTFVNLLAAEWLPNALPELHELLQNADQPRIADVACGAGWSAIALARAYPRARVDGFDIDEASIADARRNAAEAGLGDRVRFEVADAKDLEPRGYDLVCVFEAVHDLSHPVEVLSALRVLRGRDAVVLVMDERTADSFAESDGPIEAFLYGASVLHCLPVGMSERDSAGTGAVMRVGTLRTYAQRAGFADVEVLPVDHDLFRLYRLM